MSSRRSKSLIKSFPESMTLIIDTSDKYSNLENYFYINPLNLSKIKSLSSDQFSKVIIKNTKVELITPLFLTNLFAKMKIKGKGEIIISEPISVMQSYEAKIIIANLKIGGFDEIQLNESLFYDERVNKKIPTLSVTFIRNEKRGNLKEEIYKKNENRINKNLKGNNMGGIKRRSTTQNKNNNILNKGININESFNNQRVEKKLNTQNISPSKLDNVPYNRRLSKPIEVNYNNKNDNASRGNITQNNINDRRSKYNRRK